MNLKTAAEMAVVMLRENTPYTNVGIFVGSKGEADEVLRMVREQLAELGLYRALLDNTDWAHGVVDPFGGSGTTLMACEEMGQPCFMAELEPGFVDTIVYRWAKATGRLDEIRLIRAGEEVPRTEWEALMEE